MMRGLDDPAIVRRLALGVRPVEGHDWHVLVEIDLAKSDGHRRVLAAFPSFALPVAGFALPVAGRDELPARYGDA